MPSLETLNNWFSYDPRDGVLRRRVGGKRRGVGSAVGFTTPGGYLRTDTPDGRFLVHRIIWKMVTRGEPPKTIDHRNGNRSDNRWSNLREADDFQNAQNAKRHSRSKSPYKGIYRCATTGRWAACINNRGQAEFLGRYDTPEAAHAAYAAAAELRFGEFARVA